MLLRVGKEFVDIGNETVLHRRARGDMRRILRVPISLLLCVLNANRFNGDFRGVLPVHCTRLRLSGELLVAD